MFVAYCILPSPSYLSAQQIPVPQFEGPQTTVSDAGHVRLVWLSDADLEQREDIQFELQQATDEEFETARTIYTGPDLASFISGLPNGDFFFRVRALVDNGNRAGSWSEPITVKVQHHSLKLAFTLFALGAIVFIATAAMIVTGNRNSEKSA